LVSPYKSFFTVCDAGKSYVWINRSRAVCIDNRNLADRVLARLGRGEACFPAGIAPVGVTLVYVIVFCIKKGRYRHCVSIGYREGNRDVNYVRVKRIVVAF